MKQISACCIALACLGIAASAFWSAPATSAPRISPQMNSANFSLDWSAVREMSGGASTFANYRLNATVGQMAANTSSTSTNHGLCTGFQCIMNSLRVYLPLVLRWRNRAADMI